jgi:uncharacterized membrane protein HdeD (DUF308 family)
MKEVKGTTLALGLWGTLSVVFGVLIVAWPGLTLATFLILLGIYLVVTGVVTFIGALANRNNRHVGTALVGVISAIAGLYVFSNPGISALVALTVIAIWAIAVGLLQIVAGFEGKNNWLMILAGVVYALFGLYIFANPAGGALTLLWLIALSNVVGGIALIVASFELHHATKKA